jgi:hypothetical protein
MSNGAVCPSIMGFLLYRLWSIVLLRRGFRSQTTFTRILFGNGESPGIILKYDRLCLSPCLNCVPFVIIVIYTGQGAYMRVQEGANKFAPTVNRIRMVLVSAVRLTFLDEVQYIRRLLLRPLCNRL